MVIHDDEINAANLDIKQVRAIARKLENLGKQAAALGIQIFGASGSGQLRFNDRHDAGNLILADLCGGIWDGGDGGSIEDSRDGLLRGEWD